MNTALTSFGWSIPVTVVIIAFLYIPSQKVRLLPRMELLVLSGLILLAVFFTKLLFMDQRISLMPHPGTATSEYQLQQRKTDK